MEASTNARELFIIEIIINYLQSVYPQIYSDKEIIRKYIQYNKLINKKYLSEENKNVKFTNEDKERLDELNILFFGNEDGTNSSYADLPGNYLMTIRTIKELIKSDNQSIKDTISIIYSLFDNNEISENSEALNYYLNEIIIPSLLMSLGSNYINENINTKISNEEYTFDKYKEIENEEISRIEREKAEKENEKKKLKEKEKKLIEKRKEEKKEQEKLDEKIKAEIEAKTSKEKNENQTKIRNDIKIIKKDLDDKLEKFKLNIILNSSSKLKAVINQINNYADCNIQLTNNTDEDIKNFLMKYCEILKLRADINDSSDIKKIKSLKEKINNKIKDLTQEFGKFSKKTEITDEKLIINKKIKEMDIFFNKDYSDYNEVFGIEKTKNINLQTNYKELEKLIIKFNKLKINIAIYEFNKSDRDFKNFINQLKYYFTLLKTFIQNIMKYNLYNKLLFEIIIDELIEDKNEFFKITNKKQLYQELKNKITHYSDDTDDNNEKIKCIVYNSYKDIENSLDDDGKKILDDDNNNNIFDKKKFNKYLEYSSYIQDKSIPDGINCHKFLKDNINNKIVNIYLYFIFKYENTLKEINNIISDNNNYSDNYRELIEQILYHINIISKCNTTGNDKIQTYIEYIKSIDIYQKFVNDLIKNKENSDNNYINEIKNYMNKNYIDKF